MRRLPQLAPHGCRVQEEQPRHREHLGGRHDDKCQGRGCHGDRRARNGRPQRLHDRRPQHPFNPVRGQQVVGRKHGRQQRRVGGVEEPLADSEDRGRDHEVPDLEGAHQRESGNTGHDQHFCTLDGEQDAFLRDAIGQHSAEQHREDHADSAAGGHQRELDRRAAQRDDLPDQRHQPDARAEQRHGERDSEDAVLAVGERRERPRESAARWLRWRHPLLTIMFTV